ncbi:DNA -binding domain-containing protein [Novosphingobium fluoreni]
MRPATGGFIFVEDPAHDCTCVLPIWSAALDPGVLRARIVVDAGQIPSSFDFQRAGLRRVASSVGEHIAFDRAGEVVRIDVIDGAVSPDRANLCFEIIADHRLERQIRALQSLFSPFVRQSPNGWFKRQHLALLANDLSQAGASLREAADVLLGPGEWPGDGEHRKSQVRRLVKRGLQLCHSTPGGILAG